MKTEIPARLRWACRRGMLELDVLLGNFLNQAYSGLSESEQNLFIRLLDCSDQDLFMWLTGKELPTDEELGVIVAKIRYLASK